MQQAWPHVFAAGEVEFIDHSLLVTLAGSDPALKPVMLMGHMDVVPVVPGTEADWTHAPFSGHVDDTYIWGRGAIDMKDRSQVFSRLSSMRWRTVGSTSARCCWPLARTRRRRSTAQAPSAACSRSAALSLST